MSIYEIPLSKDFTELAILTTIQQNSLKQEDIEILFQKCLDKHDANYDYSDDARVYDKGKQELIILRDAKEAFSYLVPLWETYWEAYRENSKNFQG